MIYLGDNPRRLLVCVIALGVGHTALMSATERVDLHIALLPHAALTIGLLMWYGSYRESDINPRLAERPTRAFLVLLAFSSISSAYATSYCGHHLWSSSLLLMLVAVLVAAAHAALAPARGPTWGSALISAKGAAMLNMLVKLSLILWFSFVLSRPYIGIVLPLLAAAYFFGRVCSKRNLFLFLRREGSEHQHDVLRRLTSASVGLGDVVALSLTTDTRRAFESHVAIQGSAHVITLGDIGEDDAWKESIKALIDRAAAIVIDVTGLNPSRAEQKGLEWEFSALKKRPDLWHKLLCIQFDRSPIPTEEMKGAEHLHLKQVEELTAPLKKWLKRAINPRA